MSHVGANLKELPATLLATAVLGVLALVWPAGALAQTCQAPPGTSGIEQYCEMVPGLRGEHGSDTRVNGRSGVTPNVAAELSKQGSVGAGVLSAVGARGDSEAVGRAEQRDESQAPKGSGQDDEDKAPAGDGAALAALKSAADSGPSAGPSLVWALVGLAVLLAAAAWMRARAERT